MNLIHVFVFQIFWSYILLQDFPEKAWEPKVQLPYKAEQDQVPRKIEIERFVMLLGGY